MRGNLPRSNSDVNRVNVTIVWKVRRLDINVRLWFSFGNHLAIAESEESIDSVTIVYRDSDVIEITLYKGQRRSSRRWLCLHKTFRYLAIRDSPDLI